MHTLLVLLRKDFTNFFRNKPAVSLTFLVPFVMIYVFGQVFGVNRSQRGPSDIPLAVVDASGQPAAASLIAALRAEKAFKIITEHHAGELPPRPLTEADLRPLMRAGAFRFAVVLPADRVSGTALGVHVKIYASPRNEIETQMVNGILQKTIMASVPQLLGRSLQLRGAAWIGSEQMQAFNQSLAGTIAQHFSADFDEVLQRIEQGDLGVNRKTDPTTSDHQNEAVPSLLERLVRIETENVTSRDVKSPAATRLVGGFAIQFLLFALSSSAAALLAERDRGIFHRILAGPVSRAQILWSKFLYGTALGVFQLLVMFIGGRVLYGIEIEHQFGSLALVSIATAGACTAFGMLLASICSTPEAASGVATFAILLMCSVGGAWFPISLMPAAIQQLSKLTIVFWGMQGFEQVLWLDASFRELWPTLGVLLATAGGAMGIAVWRFNRSNVFG